MDGEERETTQVDHVTAIGFFEGGGGGRRGKQRRYLASNNGQRPQQQRQQQDIDGLIKDDWVENKIIIKKRVSFLVSPIFAVCYY